MTQLLPKFGPPATNRVEIAAALGVDPGNLHGDRPLQSVSCGVPFFFVPLRTRSAVDAVAVDRRAFTHALTAAGIEPLPVFVFTNEKGGGDETVYSRMLAPQFGIAEHPATGGASGPLGSYLLHHGMVSAAQARSMVAFRVSR
jgi:trans-2,3-dihydro-3-hydroxyanthranilate isomerase